MATELFIYDVIDPWWGVSANAVVRALRDIKGDVTVRINSPGGDAFDGIAIYNALKRHAEKGKVTVEVDGLAASAASIIAMAGDQIIVAKGAMLMIHCAWSFTIGDAGEHEKRASMLSKLDTQIAGVYAARSKKSEAECLELMQDETWMGADEAVELGFADSIGAAKARKDEEPSSKAAARVMSSFKKTPVAWGTPNKPPREQPADLRDGLDQSLRIAAQVRDFIRTPMSDLARR